MYKDRGNLKWIPFLMPEHKALLYEYYKEKQKIPMPEMDEQMMFFYEEVINEALIKGNQIKVTYYDNISSNMKSCNGYVQRIDYFDKCVRLIKKQNDIECIAFDKIVGIELIDGADS